MILPSLMILIFLVIYYIQLIKIENDNKKAADEIKDRYNRLITLDR